MLKKILLIIFLFLGLGYFVYAQEQITITTYYPSPFGSYRELQWGNLPASRGSLNAEEGSSIELGGSGQPFIALFNDMTSATPDFRIELDSDDRLDIQGGETYFMTDGQAPANVKVKELWLCVSY